MKSFYVIINDFNRNKMVPYDIIPHLVREYEKLEEKPTSFENFKRFIINESKYQWWSRTEYEILLSDWPCKKYTEKWDIYKQIMMNIDLITETFINEINS